MEFLLFVLIVLNTILLFVILVYLKDLGDRLARIEEMEADRQRPAPEPPRPRVVATPAPAVPAPPPDPVPAPAPVVPPAPAPAAEIAPRVPEPPAAPVPPRPVPPPVRPPARVEPEPEPAASWFSEESVGGAWLQNVGSVVVLLGVFFLFLWGYTTGRFGPGVLVAAGVALGAILVWRGDRTIGGLPGFGHALVGIGFGVAYLSLHAGYFVFALFGLWVAILLLAAVSIGAILAGIRYRVQLIALLGVIGAFVPWIASTLVGRLPDTGTDVALLVYFAAIDAAVVALAARSGWSALTITATLLTTGTWLVATHGPWSMPVEIGLGALYLGLGLALAPRFTRDEPPARTSDLLAIAITPWCFVIASLPYFFAAPPASAAWILGGMAAAYIAAAAWIASHREQRDLWSHFVVAATVFVAAALERALGETLTPMAWCVQGAVMIALGLGPRTGLLRGLGFVATTIGALLALSRLLLEGGSHGFLTADSVRVAVVGLTVLLVARMLDRHRDRLLPEEVPLVPNAALTVAQGVLASWLGVHMGRVALLIVPPGLADGLRPTLAVALQALGWAVQGGGLVLAGLKGSTWKRVLGYGLVTGALGFTAIAGFGFGAWNLAVTGPMHALGATMLETLLVLTVVCERLSRKKDRLANDERGIVRPFAFILHVAALAWIPLQASTLARAFVATADVPFASAGLASAGWLALAVLVFGLGWFRRSAFLRWLGIGTLGLTLVKFVLVDLARVDMFWRFVTAIAVGVVLLAISYVYQRARRTGGRDGAS